MQSGMVKNVMFFSPRQLGVRICYSSLNEHQVEVMYQTATGATKGKCSSFVRKVEGRAGMDRKNFKKSQKPRGVFHVKCQLASTLCCCSRAESSRNLLLGIGK